MQRNEGSADEDDNAEVEEQLEMLQDEMDAKLSLYEELQEEHDLLYLQHALLVALCDNWRWIAERRAVHDGAAAGHADADLRVSAEEMRLLRQLCGVRYASGSPFTPPLADLRPRRAGAKPADLTAEPPPPLRLRGVDDSLAPSDDPYLLLRRWAHLHWCRPEHHPGPSPAEVEPWDAAQLTKFYEDRVVGGFSLSLLRLTTSMGCPNGAQQQPQQAQAQALAQAQAQQQLQQQPQEQEQGQQQQAQQAQARPASAHSAAISSDGSPATSSSSSDGAPAGSTADSSAPALLPPGSQQQLRHAHDVAPAMQPCVEVHVREIEGTLLKWVACMLSLCLAGKSQMIQEACLTECGKAPAKLSEPDRSRHMAALRQLNLTAEQRRHIAAAFAVCDRLNRMVLAEMRQLQLLQAASRAAPPGGDARASDGAAPGASSPAGGGGDDELTAMLLQQEEQQLRLQRMTMLMAKCNNIAGALSALVMGCLSARQVAQLHVHCWPGVLNVAAFCEVVQDELQRMRRRRCLREPV